MLGVHCENVEVIPLLREPLRAAGRDDLAAWNEQSPDFLEAENVHRACYFAGKVGCPINIVHLSSREALDEVRRHRRAQRGADVRRDLSALPATSPIRRRRACSRRSIRRCAARATSTRCGRAWPTARSTTVGTDHVPRKRSTKEGKGIWASSNGFPGVATMLPILLHEGYHRRGIAPERIAAVLSRNAARIYNMRGQRRARGRCTTRTSRSSIRELTRAVDAARRSNRSPTIRRTRA